MGIHERYATLRCLVESNNAGFRVLLVDNRVVGETKTDFPFSLEDIAEDIYEIWLELDITASCIRFLGGNDFTDISLQTYRYCI